MVQLLKRFFASISSGLAIGRRTARSRSDSSTGSSGRAEAVRFLREWLPPAAVESYRQMIRANPESWYRDPHFASGYFVDTILRGNGITEQMLDAKNLDEVWPALLREVVEEEPESSLAPPAGRPGKETS